MTITLLGRQPKLGLAELESIFGAASLSLIRDDVALIERDWQDVTRQPLGSVIKSAEIIATVSSRDWQKVSRRLIKLASETAASDEGKITFGISVIGFPIHARDIEKTGLNLKRELKRSGRPVRYVQNKELELSSATVLHNSLTRGENNYEWLIVASDDKTFIARAHYIQDIDAYSARDHGRPKRDAFVGMLPPKLAQIMINLATSRQITPASGDGVRGSAQNSLSVTKILGADTPAGPEESDAHKHILQSKMGEANVVVHGRSTILDPFCGTGVVLQEALLMGYDTYGTDLSSKMIDYSRINLDWLNDKYDLKTAFTLEQADAQDHKWHPPISAVACEGYLGQPFSAEPQREKLESVMFECNSIMKNFLKNISSQIEPGTPLCIAMPAWHIRDQIHHLPLLQDLEKLGFTRVKFQHATPDDLIYHRPGQIVGRELVVLKK